jgi:hypothetical protein
VESIMRVIIVAILAALATPALAAERAMHLCPNAIMANDFWSDLVSIHSTGVKLTKEMIMDVGKKNGCKFVVSDHIRPTEFRNGAFAVTDGKVVGWVMPDAYIAYANQP